jgi:hypothetical protein
MTSGAAVRIPLTCLDFHCPKTEEKRRVERKKSNHSFFNIFPDKSDNVPQTIVWNNSPQASLGKK